MYDYYILYLYNIPEHNVIIAESKKDFVINIIVYSLSVSLI